MNNLVANWKALSVINQSFLVFFSVVFIYSVISCFATAFATTSEASQLRVHSSNLGKRLHSLRQLHAFAFLLFVFCILVQIPDIFFTLGTSKSVPIETYVKTTRFLFFFDAKVCLAFLFLHSLQWLASSRARERI